MLKRIQRKRVRGWRLPADAVCITRPGRYSNPYRIGDRFDPSLSHFKWYGDGLITLDSCLQAFWSYAENRILAEPHWLDPLFEKDVACFCSLNAPCHGDILITIIRRLKERRQTEQLSRAKQKRMMKVAKNG